jgi:hypothetical protein
MTPRNGPSTQLSYLRAADFTPAEIIWLGKFGAFYDAKPDTGVPAEQHAPSAVLAGS